MKPINYTYKNIEFVWYGGLKIGLPKEFRFLKLQINNGSLGWRLNSKVRLSVKQLKVIIKMLGYLTAQKKK